MTTNDKDIIYAIREDAEKGFRLQTAAPTLIWSDKYPPCLCFDAAKEY